ncbi:MAG: hypothetical protein EOM05_04295 [Clostridia bacterium]|nr:hypothetical protein [Clostridia bacterium]
MSSKECRFIDSRYNPLFTVPDGGKITISYPHGERITKTCKHLDDYHTDIGGHCFHICEFAEKMEGIGAKYAPEKPKNKDFER